MASALRSSTGRWAKGYGFHPTDEELMEHYLKQKMLGNEHLVTQIAEVNVCDHEPWELPAFSVLEPDHPKWYFFCPRNYKYSNSQRSNRTTKAGYWKVTGKDRKIKNVGIKKTLVFYKGRTPNGVRTKWIMHEYSLNYALPNAQRELVLCKLKTDADNMPGSEEGEPNSVVASDFGNQNCNGNNYGPTNGDWGFSPPMNYDYGTASYAPQEEYSYEVQAHLQPFFGYNEGDYDLNAALQFRYRDMH
ncbi:hypothetical protein Tsubulata_018324 [Turnera subulata]|uniref:NAC domain-containing protein n=1 Tax=Turnera subulata TaxID=218843 RepID=A0A9Q0JQD5_9ROSI|nr:hypothetical protein Tsubulata_018324 [Turnera subulata]